jgi:tRNA U34 2-thiouridine synthase MnmA/TrmU
MRSELQARGVNWLSRPAPETELRARVRIRHRHAEADATLRPLGADAVDVVFDVPQRAVTPGQAASSTRATSASEAAGSPEPQAPRLCTFLDLQFKDMDICA